MLAVDDRVWARAVADRVQGRAVADRVQGRVGGDRVQGRVGGDRVLARAVVGAAAGGAAGVVVEGAGANAVRKSDKILNLRAVEVSTSLRSPLQADHDDCKVIFNSE